MKTILFNLILLGILLFGFSSCAEMDPVDPDPICDLDYTQNHPYAYRYERILDEFTKAGVPGVSIAVISPEGTWAGTAGKADIANNVDLTPCHTLRIGSVSKVLTSVAILKLYDEGIVDIDAKLNQYVPRGITDRIDNANEVTVRQLLDHSSGIAEHNDLASHIAILNQTEVNQSAEQRLESIYGKKAWFEPGEDARYSNSNYLLLALVLKYATGESSGYEVVKKYVIDPLSLDNTFPGNEIPSTLSRGYYDTYDNGFMQDLTEIDNNAVGGEDRLDGGYISNPYDLATFAKAVFSGGFLSPQSLAEMQKFKPITEEVPDMITGYGLGLMQIRAGAATGVGHSGEVHCFNNMIAYFPEQDVAIAVSINGGSAKAFDVLYREETYTKLFND